MMRLFLETYPEDSTPRNSSLLPDPPPLKTYPEDSKDDETVPGGLP
jgi:hypothetical protein